MYHIHMFVLDKMVFCVQVHVDGTLEQMNCEHEKIHEILGGRLTFVGTIPEKEISCVALAAQDSNMEKNMYPFRDTFDLPIFGPVFFVKNDDEGVPLDLLIRDLSP